VALLFGVGLTAALVVSLTVSVVRLFTLRGLSFVHPRLPVETEAGVDADLTVPCPRILRDPAGRRRLIRGGTEDGPPALPRGVWILDLAAGDRGARLAAGWSRQTSPPREVHGIRPDRGLYRIAAAEIVFPDPLSLVQVRFRARPPLPVHGRRSVGGVMPPLLRVLPRPAPLSSEDPDPELAAGRRRGDLSNERNEELIETRPYHPGDDIRRINWSAFAHSGELFLRIGEETPPPAWAVRVVVDTRGVTGVASLDTLIATALGTAQRLEPGGVIRISLRTPLHPEHELGGFVRARRILAAVDATEGLLPGYRTGIDADSRDDGVESGWNGAGGDRSGAAVTESEAAIVVAWDEATGSVVWRPRHHGGCEK
jgi:uncharacterized protein (DUF58 family)